jgi:uncharacterized membrane protein YgdD (TMEM256/DUF423 family)
MGRIWIAVGSIFGLSTVAMAAYQAHGMAGAPPGSVAAVGSAVQMQGLHALVLLFAGLRAEQRGGLVHFAGLAFVLGTMLFCGTVYAGAIPALAAWHVPPLAPIGGTTLMLGWALLFVSAWRR